MAILAVLKNRRDSVVLNSSAAPAASPAAALAPAISYTTSAFMEDAGPFPTFSTALKDFIERMKKKTSGGGVPLVMLEQGSWIECTNSTGGKMAIGFYDARDFGYVVGLLAGKGCEFQDGVVEPDPRLVSDLYTAVMTGTGEDFISRLREGRS